MKDIYAYLGVLAFAHNFKKVEQVTQEDDVAYSIRGLHDIQCRYPP